MPMGMADRADSGADDPDPFGEPERGRPVSQPAADSGSGHTSTDSRSSAREPDGGRG
jgi:hypothetical protein